MGGGGGGAGTFTDGCNMYYNTVDVLKTDIGTYQPKSAVHVIQSYRKAIKIKVGEKCHED